MGDVNRKLDELVLAEGDSGKAKVLGWLVHKTSPTQMKWIVQIILKVMKVRIGRSLCKPCETGCTHPHLPACNSRKCLAANLISVCIS